HRDIRRQRSDGIDLLRIERQSLPALPRPVVLPELLPVDDCLFALVEAKGPSQTHKQSLRPGNTHLSSGLHTDLGIQVGRIQSLEDRLDQQLAVERLVQYQLVLPQCLAVAYLQEPARRIRKAPRYHQ